MIKAFFKKIVRFTQKTIEMIFSRLLMLFFTLFKIKRDRVIVISYYGKGYGDNGKYILNALLCSDDNPEVIWALNDVNSFLPTGIKPVKYKSLKYYYLLATSRVLINNTRFPLGIRKRKKQFYIQVWHGGFPIKRIEKSVEKNLGKGYVLGAKNDSRMIDLLLSNNGFLTKIYKNDFWYDGRILECGCPRNDIIFNNDKDIIDKVYNHYDLDKNVKICLYAPTFRVDESLSAYNIDFNQLKNNLESKFGGKWKILIRLHPNISKKSTELIDYSEDIIDASRYDDMQELLVAADFMITDYSSCIFDYAISKKKCCIYASDLDDYSRDRGFYLSLDEYPFEIARNNKELADVIEHFDEKKNKKRITEFFDKVKSFEDGKGAETVANIICDVINGKYDEKK